MRVRNVGNGPASWGYGSSGCQLGAVVAFEGESLAIADRRVCVTDYVEHSLAPGESRTEAMSWSGSVRKDDSTELLPPGTYEVRGAAGSFVGDTFVEVEVGVP